MGGCFSDFREYTGGAKRVYEGLRQPWFSAPAGGSVKGAALGDGFFALL